jgi:hypothetical protein
LVDVIIGKRRKPSPLGYVQHNALLAMSSNSRGV